MAPCLSCAAHRAEHASSSDGHGDAGSNGATLVTRFDADVTEVVGVDDAQGWLYFIASPSNPTQRYLYRSKLDGSGTPERVTPADQPGTHTYDVAPGAHLAFHTWSQIRSARRRPTSSSCLRIVRCDR